MRFKTMLIAVASLALAGCDYDDNATDNDDIYYRDTDTTTGVGRDAYPQGVPDRTSTEHGVTQGGIAAPNSQSNALSEMDRTFIPEAAMAGMFEIESSQLARERNVDAQLSQIASMMIEDHTKANQELMAIARQKGVTVPQGMNDHFRRMLTQLQSASGEDFARRFQSQQEQAHREAITLFDREARQGQDPDLRAFAQRTLPVLRKHLDYLQQYRPSDDSFNNPPDRGGMEEP